jgi:hypothetical protein
MYMRYSTVRIYVFKKVSKKVWFSNIVTVKSEESMKRMLYIYISISMIVSISFAYIVNK